MVLPVRRAARSRFPPILQTASRLFWAALHRRDRARPAAGLAVAGFERVSAAARRGKAAVLVLAADGAEGGRRKLRALGRGLPVSCVLTAVELGAAFGRDEVVNAALGPGPLGARLVADAEKIAGFRAGAVVERAPRPDPGDTPAAGAECRRRRMTVLERDERRD